MSIFDHDNIIAKIFLKVFNYCPACGAKELDIVRDKWSSPVNDGIGIRCNACKREAIATVNKKCIYTLDSFKREYITLPAHINIDDVSKQIMMLKSDPNEWEIDTNVIKQLAIFCLNKFKENKDIENISRLIEEK
jgi:hypothetical protein